MALKTISPKHYTHTFGAFVIKGFSDGTMVEIDQVNQDYDEKIGLDLTSRVQTYDGVYTVTITLQQTAELNGFLANLRNTSLSAGFGGALPFSITNAKGNIVFSSPTAYIRKSPTYSLSKTEVTDRVWILVCVDCVDNLQGDDSE